MSAYQNTVCPDERAIERSVFKDQPWSVSMDGPTSDLIGIGKRTEILLKKHVGVHTIRQLSSLSSSEYYKFPKNEIVEVRLKRFIQIAQNGIKFLEKNTNSPSSSSSISAKRIREQKMPKESQLPKRELAEEIKAEEKAVAQNTPPRPTSSQSVSPQSSSSPSISPNTHDRHLFRYLAERHLQTGGRTSVRRLRRDMQVGYKRAFRVHNLFQSDRARFLPFATEEANGAESQNGKSEQTVSQLQLTPTKTSSPQSSSPLISPNSRDRHLFRYLAQRHIETGHTSVRKLRIDMQTGYRRAFRVHTLFESDRARFLPFAKCEPTESQDVDMEPVGGELEPVVGESSSDNLEPVVGESSSENLEPVAGELTREQTAPVVGELEPVGGELTCELTESTDVKMEPDDEESKSADEMEESQQSSSSPPIPNDFDELMAQDALNTVRGRSLLSDAAIGLGLEMICEGHSAVRFLLPQVLHHVRRRDSNEKPSDIVRDVLLSQGVSGDSQVDNVFIPLSDNCHWCLIVVRIPQRDILHLDSLISRCSNAGYFIQCLRPALRMIFPPPDPQTPDKWPRANTPVPRQTNVRDCGVFVLSFAQRLVAGQSLDGGPQQCAIQQLRRDLWRRFKERGPSTLFSSRGGIVCN
eukprot:112453_1